MIESREKQKRLIEIVTCWSEQAKIPSRLKKFIIPHLVDQILHEFYQITLCCGHLVASIDEGVYVQFEDKDIYHTNDEKIIIYGLCCKDCAAEYEKNSGIESVEKNA